MTNEKKIFTVIGLLSASIIAFLFWLIYFKSKPFGYTETWVESLPALNAILNTLTSAFLLNGFFHIKQNRIDKHKKAMYLATFTSALFLVSYVIYHHFHGDTSFLATGLIRPVYFFILITHILLSIAQVPLILITHYLAYVKNFTKHKKMARITFPIWLYVSVTGVMIFIILKWFNETL